MRPGVTIAVTGAEKNALHAKEGVQIDGGLLYACVAGEVSKWIKTDGDIVVKGGVVRLYTTGDACYDADAADTSSSAGKATGISSSTVETSC